MRNATICFLLLLCSVLAFGQEPQWTVVKHVVLLNQTQSVRFENLLTPTEPALYRLSFYFSGNGNGAGQSGYYSVSLNGTDISGMPLGAGGYVLCYQIGWNSTTTTAILKPQAHLSYTVFADNSSTNCTYNLAITIEQLVQ